MLLFLACLLAIISDQMLGDPKKWKHPVVYIGNMISFFERKWNHTKFRKVKGLLTVVIVVVTITVAVFSVVVLAMKIHIALWLFVEVAFISLALAQKSLWEAAMLVYDALQRGDIQDARHYLSWIVGRDTAHLDEPEIVRGVIETVSENTSDGITAPLFYALLFGSTGAWCYKAINTLDSMIGYKNERYEDFGYFAAKLDDVANFLPSRISGFMLLFITKNYSSKRFCERFKRWLVDAKKHPSPNSGYLEAATAYQLGIRLGGYNRYGQLESFRAYMGEPLFVMGKQHILEALKQMRRCTYGCLLLGGIFYAIASTWS
ncbi:adenosylcobinamide-phosphate synthase CbiB [Solibacillus sp. MA9]|uniref:Cobalamin biosynthesis protein CobD n=1 Tax=Solibacillus palustris TaxID=2908203 RepID=A0ABS9UCB6_9BACL|nr:adenosylcobinamide-phosphate synthase CbiB [Solibacillus sp. MA9]MCH7321949.1 adenosylcobinamide-phosphate synthase CbiB [Solibacillus sp. MA9]